MEPTDLTIEILKDIRQEMRETKEEIRETKEEIRHTREDLHDEIHALSGRVDRLHTRITETDIRTATAMTDLVGTLHEMRDEFRCSKELRPRVERCEQDIADIKRRLPES
jgi:predicted  nucleic acid-binding Zn-ribbon protein